MPATGYPGTLAFQTIEYIWNGKQAKYMYEQPLQMFRQQDQLSCRKVPVCLVSSVYFRPRWLMVDTLEGPEEGRHQWSWKRTQ